MPDRAPLSIIIPTLDCAASLENTVSQLIEGVQDGLVRDLVICDGGSSDNVKSVSDALGAKFVVTRQGRGTQLATGANVATGSWLLFVHADTLLETGWSKVARNAMYNSCDHAYCFRLKFNMQGFWPTIFASWANFRAGVIGLPFGDQGLLIHRQLYEAVGGYSRIPLMEDFDIARRLKSRWRMLPVTAETSAEHYRNQGWIRRGCGNLLLQLRFLAGAHPETLAARYQPKHRSGVDRRLAKCIDYGSQGSENRGTE